MAGEGYFASRCKGAEPRRKIAARQAIARPARAAAVALQRRPEARALPGWGEDQPVSPEDGGPGQGREPVYLFGCNIEFCLIKEHMKHARARNGNGIDKKKQKSVRK